MTKGKLFLAIILLSLSLIPRLEAGFKEDLLGDSRWKWVEQVQNSYFGDSTKTFGELLNHPQIKKVDWGGFDTDTTLGQVVAGLNGNLFANLLIEVKEPAIYEYDLKIYFQIEEGRRPKLVSVQGLENNYGLPAVIKHVASFITSLENPSSNLIEDFKTASQSEAEESSFAIAMTGELPVASEPFYLIGLSKEEMMQQQEKEPNFISVNGQPVPNPKKKLQPANQSSMPPPTKLYYPDGTLKEDGEGYVNGKREGLWKTYYPNGQLKSALTFKAGEFDGVAKLFHQNGAVAEETQVQNGLWEGLHKEYYEDGVLKEEEEYQGGITNGSLKRYYRNGKLSLELKSVRGLPADSKKTYYPSGAPKMVCTYTAGRIAESCVGYAETGGIAEGAVRAKYPSGNLESEISYVTGAPSGSFKEYYDGNLRREGQYKDGKPFGVFKTYFESGKLESETSYTEGVREGPYKNYYETGGVSQEGTNNNWQLDGMITIYRMDGTVSEQKKFSMGQQIS